MGSSHRASRPSHSGQKNKQPMPNEIPELSDYSAGSLDHFFSSVLAQFEQEASAARTAEAIEQLRIRWIGRKQGLLIKVSDTLKGAPAEDRREVGKRFNALKAAIDPRCDPEKAEAGASLAED